MKTYFAVQYCNIVHIRDNSIPRNCKKIVKICHFESGIVQLKADSMLHGLAEGKAVCDCPNLIWIKRLVRQKVRIVKRCDALIASLILLEQSIYL